jgi:cell division septal protein FtsQ
MWFKRKLANRRLGRGYVLDVKLRSSQVRSARTRLIAVSLGCVFAVVCGAFLLWRASDWVLDALIYENEEFAIREIDVQTDGIISPEQLKRWAGVRKGQNLLSLDLARVKRDLELVSRIHSASLERVPPHMLRIRVVEREPMAQITLACPAPGGGIEMVLFLVDNEGYVMLPVEPRHRATPPPQPPQQLPALAGFNGNEVQSGRRLESPQVKAALQLLQAFEGSPLESLIEIKRIDVSSPEVLLVTTSQGSEVTLGLKDLPHQLRRWREIHEMGQRLGKFIATLDLAVSNNIPARWLEASAAPAPPVKPTKSPHSRKKHV